MFQIIGILLIAIGVVLMVILQGLRRIPANPPQVALVTFFGERIQRVKKEGWRFFFCYPYIFGYIPVGITKVNQDFTPQEVRTPDKADIKVSVQTTWNPDGDDPEFLIAFLNSGGENGVNNIIQDIISERVRQWAYSSKEGPQTWEEAQGATDKAVEAILETILTTDVTEDEMKKCRSGNGKFKLPSLGIVISRLNIGQIEVTGAVKEAADKTAKETQEKKAETVELDHVKDKIQAFINMGYSKEQALEIVQTERGKVPKTIAEHQITTNTGTGEIVSGLVGLLTKGLADKSPGQSRTKEGDEQL